MIWLVTLFIVSGAVVALIALSASRSIRLLAKKSGSYRASIMLVLFVFPFGVWQLGIAVDALSTGMIDGFVNMCVQKTIYPTPCSNIVYRSHSPIWFFLNDFIYFALGLGFTITPIVAIVKNTKVAVP